MFALLPSPCNNEGVKSWNKWSKYNKTIVVTSRWGVWEAESLVWPRNMLWPGLIDQDFRIVDLIQLDMTALLSHYGDISS